MKASWLKKCLFALVPGLALLIVAELSLRVYFYQQNATSPLALVGAYKQLKNLYLKYSARKVVGEMPDLAKTEKSVFGPEGAALLEEFKRRYQAHFEKLVQAVSAVEAKLLVLCLPSDDHPTPAHDTCRFFFRDTAAKFNVPFLDLTDPLFGYDNRLVSLRPHNGHMSRFGCQVVARELHRWLETTGDYRSPFHFAERPALMGDLPPNGKDIWEVIPSMPYRVLTNKQGFRREKDLEFPKTRQRLLILGDSFTFGPFLPNHDTYPDLLEALDNRREVINAGISGYGIVQEVSLFEERAKYCEPDIVILQVLDNDITDLFYFKINRLGRKTGYQRPTELEARFLGLNPQ